MSRTRCLTTLAAAVLTLAAAACDHDPVVPVKTLPTAAAARWVGARFDTTTSTSTFVLDFELAQGPAVAGVSPLSGTGSVYRGSAPSTPREALTVDAGGSRYAFAGDSGTLTVLLRGGTGSRIDVSCRIQAATVYSCEGTAVDSARASYTLRYETLRPID